MLSPSRPQLLLATVLLLAAPALVWAEEQPTINLSIEEGARLGQLTDAMLAGSILAARSQRQPELGRLIGDLVKRLRRTPKSDWAAAPSEENTIRLPGSGATGGKLSAVPNAWAGPDRFSLDVFNDGLLLGRITVRKHTIVMTPHEEPVLWVNGLFGGDWTGGRYAEVNTYRPAPRYCATGGLCVTRADGKVILSRRAQGGYQQVARCVPGTIGFSCLVQAGLVKSAPARPPRFQLAPAARQIASHLTGKPEGK